MRYVPSSERPRWHWTWRRRAVAAALLLLAATLGLLLAEPALHQGEFVDAFYRDTAGFVLEGLGIVLLSPLAAVVVAFLVVMAAMPILWIGRQEAGDRIIEWAAPRLFRAVRRLVPAAFVLVILLGALRAYLTPHVTPLAIAHIAAAHATTSPLLLNLGNYRLTRADAMLSGSDLAVGDNVVSIASFPPTKLFPRALPPVSDLLVRGDTLLVVTGRRLLQIDAKGDATLIARLPLDGMRLGSFADAADADHRILLTGNAGGAGYLFQLDSEGQYSKLADLDAPAVGAAGCRDSVAVATENRVVMIAPGRYPRLLFRRPQGDGPITSVRARFVGGATPACLWLVATRDHVYLDQGGLNLLLAAGIGGVITDDGHESVAAAARSLTFTLLDRKRDTIVAMQLDRAK